MPDSASLRIGDLLALRSEFDLAGKNDKLSSGARRRASTLVRVLDESIARREPHGEARFSLQDVRAVINRIIYQAGLLHNDHLAEVSSIEPGHLLPCPSCDFYQSYVAGLDRALREFEVMCEAAAVPEKEAVNAEGS